MDETVERVDPRVLETINQAIDLDEKEQTASAAQILMSLVSEFPKEAIVHSYLAWVLSRNGQNAEAIAHGEVAILLAPKSERISLVFFRALWGAGERDRAFQEMKRFVSIGRSEEYSRMMKEWERIGN
jgi:predicted Zn-dependent protease